MIHQVVPMLHVGDAVGGHALALQDELCRRGMGSEIYVELDDPDTVDRTRPFRTYDAAGSPHDVLVYQFATASSLADELYRLPQRLVVNYHNITPPDCFLAWDDQLAHHQLWGRLQLELLGKTATLGVAVSETNRADMEANGYRATAVVPPAVRLSEAVDGASSTPGPDADGPALGARWLAVGRLAPNKAIEATLAALFVYRQRFDPEATLLVVGRTALPAYLSALRHFAADLGLADAVRFAGRVGDEALGTCYARSDVLVVSSVHEGFCLPVVEAMSHGVPVVAYRQGALPEVLGEAGVLVDTLDPTALAVAVHGVVADPDRRQALTEAAGQRLATLDLGHSSARLADLLVAVHDRQPWPDGVAGRGEAGSRR